MKAKTIIFGLFLSGTALANCPNHNTVIYSCQSFNNNIQCTWNPSQGWYQGSGSNNAHIEPGVRSTRFLRAFWTPNAHIVDSNKVSFGVTICQYSYNGSLIVLYQKDRNPNIPDPRIKNRNSWFPAQWQGVKGYACVAGEGQCDFEYGERW